MTRVNESIEIPKAESAVMEVVWCSPGALSAEEIAAQLKRTQDWSDSTVGTLINRLLKKGAITAKKDPADGRRYLYRAKIKRETFVTSWASHIAEQAFDGALAPFVSQLSKRGKLTQKDIEDLKRVIQEIERGQ